MTVALPSSRSSTPVERNVELGVHVRHAKKSSPRTTCSRNSGGSMIETDSTRARRGERRPGVRRRRAAPRCRRTTLGRSRRCASTANWTDEWVGSSSYVPANGRMAVDTAFSVGAVVAAVAAVDLRAGRREHVPLGAGELQALAVGLAGLRVLNEPVERMAGVGDLRRAVGAARDAEQRLLRPRRARPACRRRAAAASRPRRRPSRCCGPRVLLEQVERAAAGVDQDPAERRARRRRRSRRGPARGCAAERAADAWLRRAASATTMSSGAS